MHVRWHSCPGMYAAAVCSGALPAQPRLREHTALRVSAIAQQCMASTIFNSATYAAVYAKTSPAGRRRCGPSARGERASR